MRNIFRKTETTTTTASQWGEDDAFTALIDANPRPVHTGSQWA